MSDPLNYSTPSSPRVRHWMLTFGTAAIFLSYLLILPSYLFTLFPGDGAIRWILLRALPATLSGVAVVAAVGFLAAALPAMGRSAVPVFACYALAVALLGERVVYSLYQLLYYQSRGGVPEAVRMLASLLGIFSFLLIAGLLTAAGIYSLALGGRLGNKVAGLIPALALVPSLIVSLISMAYQMLSFVANLTHSSFLSDYSVIRYYSTMNQVNYYASLLVWLVLTLVAGILALTRRA